MDEYIRLGGSEVPDERAFAHPDRTAVDLASIGEMVATLRSLLGGPLPGEGVLAPDLSRIGLKWTQALHPEDPLAARR